MAQPVSPWIHRVSIRDHGPDDPSERLTLFALNAFMKDETGICYPGTRKLCGATGLSRNTVMRCVRSVNVQGWVQIREGLRQRFATCYRASVPDWLDLSEYEEILGRWLERSGAAIEPDEADTPVSRTAHLVQPAPASGANGAQKGGASGANGGGHLVQPLHQKFLSEVSKRSSSEEVGCLRSPALSSREFSEKTKPEDTEAREAEKRRKIGSLRLAGYAPHEIVKLLATAGVNIEDVRRERDA